MKWNAKKVGLMFNKILLPLLIPVVFLVGWSVGLPPKEKAKQSSDDTVWTCSMHPQVRQPNKGLCPICAMDLIPLAPGGEQGLREVKVSSEAAALMDIRVSEVVREPATVDVRLFGKIAYDERNINTTTARIGGRLDRFYVDYTGTEVRKGDHIAEIYSPELFVAQQDLIKAVNRLAETKRTGTPAAVQTQERLLKSAREKLRLLELTEKQISAIEKQTEPTDHITLYSPQDGIVTERHVVEGAYVKTGDPLFSVASLNSVWLNLEAYESDLPWLHFAQDVAFTVEAVPGREFHGRIAYIDPELDPVRRVVRVRVNVSNTDKALKPGMFARSRVQAEVAGDGSVIDPGLAGKWISPMHPEIVRDEPGKCPICGMDLVEAEKLGFIAESNGEHENALLVPTSAVLRTGTRAIVYVRVQGFPDPIFEGRQIVLGPRVGDRYIVDSGLSEGEMVVTRGAFKLDSELQLAAKPSMMNPDAGLVETPAAEAEESLAGQWGAIPRALERMRLAALAGDRDALKEEVAVMMRAIKMVNSDSFHDKTSQNWKEFSMRLENALLVAANDTNEEPMIVYQEVQRAVEQAGRFLGLPSVADAQGVTQSSESVDDLKHKLSAYYALSEALAADDEKSSLEKVPILVDKLGDEGKALSQAKDIKAIRAAFKPVSNHLVALVREQGIDRVGNAYIVHCPMVNDYEGADWLSPKPTVVNPYFGSEMLSCGTVTANLSIDRSKLEMTEQHGEPEDPPKHNHQHQHSEEPKADAEPDSEPEETVDPHAHHNHGDDSGSTTEPSSEE